MLRVCIEALLSSNTAETDSASGNTNPFFLNVDLKVALRRVNNDNTAEERLREAFPTNHTYGAW